MPTVKIFKFFEYIHRMAYIMRWSLMDCRKQEDLKQHSQDVAVVSHALVVIHNDVLGLPRKLDAAKAALLAIFHDAGEIFTGDVPTPIKYFGGGVMKGIPGQDRRAGFRETARLPSRQDAACVPRGP